MGNTFTVDAWGEWDGKGNGYSYMSTYSGESFLKALFCLWKTKREGYGCVKLSWR